MMALPRYQDQGRPFLAFVYGIAAHKVADAHRASARNKSDPTDEVPERFSLDSGPEQRAIDADAAARMDKLLQILPEKQREILILRVVVGMSAEETAEAVGSTAGAVRVAQHRALAKLRGEVTSTGYGHA
ncbi:RNA polymerase sigma70 factor [Mycolicibacterium brumae DSM 44177]|nr:RNA polymerase sigma70 factor [Mycolicibacterium brumae DSM 44177]